MCDTFLCLVEKEILAISAFLNYISIEKSLSEMNLGRKPQNKIQFSKDLGGQFDHFQNVLGLAVEWDLDASLGL